MTEFRSNEEFVAALGAIVDRWCEERNVRALACLLPAYVGFNGQTDGWHELLASLQKTRALGHEAFNPTEWDALNNLIHAADLALRTRG